MFLRIKNDYIPEEINQLKLVTLVCHAFLAVESDLVNIYTTLAFTALGVCVCVCEAGNWFDVNVSSLYATGIRPLLARAVN
jgi:hypothetical protein